MTTSRAVTTEIQSLLDFLMASGIAIFATPVLDRQGHVTWRSSSSLPPSLVLRRPHPSVLDYRHWIESGAYSAILQDGGLLQISYQFAGNQVDQHRLAYVPCPYPLTSRDISAFDIGDLVERYDDCHPSDVVLSSTVRFDFDMGAAAPEHPASHMTINSSECRVPCAAPLRLGHFIEFVFRHFYPEHWSSQPFLRKLTKETWMGNTATTEERQGIHLAWAG